MKSSLERQLHLIGAIYDAALDVSYWTIVLGEMVRVLDGVGGAMLVCESAQRRIVQVANLDLDSSHVRDYNNHFCQLDPIAAALEAAPDGAILPHHQIIAPTHARETEFYNDFALPLDCGDGVAVRVRVNQGSVALFNICAHLNEASCVTPDRIALFRTLLPHLQRSLHMRELLGDLSVERDCAQAALDRLEHAVALVHRSGRVLFLNAKASTGHLRAEGISVGRDGVLHAGCREETASLQRLIASATTGVGAGAHGGSVMVRHPSGLRPFAVHVMPLVASDAHPLSKGAAAMVVIVDTNAECIALPDTLMHLYRLTQAEARVAACALHGEGLQHIAEALEITLSTVRIHLQRVFEKTGTHRQAELVGLLVRLQAGLHHPNPAVSMSRH